jgi:RNA polymerase sigma-70 factor (ECF subfamily)
MTVSELLSREAMFDRHFDAVYAYIAYRVAPDRQAAEDLTQEVFLAAFESMTSFRGDGTVLSWLRMIARNKVADHLRAKTATQDVAALAGIEDPAGRATAEWTERQERAVRVSRALRQLPAGYADVLEEKYLDGLSVREMARRRGQSEKAVESALGRARAAFRGIYGHLPDAQETDVKELRL